MKHIVYMTFLQIATQLDNAASNQKAIPQLHLEQNFSLMDAYEIQKEVIQHRIGRGDRISGVKMGFTSDAKRIQMGIDDLIWGRLTDSMEIANGGFMDMGRFIHPRVEPEVAFRINQTIDRPILLEEIHTVTDSLALALEIIDSRYENFKFSLEDVVADNCSSSAYVLGDWLDSSVAFRQDQISLEIDGASVHEGYPDAIMGNPFQSLVDAIRLSLDNGLTLEAGHVVLAGAITPAVYLKPGQQVMCHSHSLGTVSFHN